jgi:hypothetical protein
MSDYNHYHGQDKPLLKIDWQRALREGQAILRGHHHTLPARIYALDGSPDMPIHGAVSFEPHGWMTQSWGIHGNFQRDLTESSLDIVGPTFEAPDLSEDERLEQELGM